MTWVTRLTRSRLVRGFFPAAADGDAVKFMDNSGAELARFALAGGMPYTGIVMCTIVRQGGEWKLHAIGECINAKTPRDAIPQLAPFLG